jgi:hypothetical protein
MRLESACVEILVLPLKNATLPVTVPPSCAVTVAVNVTDCPKLEGFCEETNVVVVDARVTTRATFFGELLAIRLEAVNKTKLIRPAATFMQGLVSLKRD